MSTPKKNPTVGACGIDCVLCPRYYTEGKSRCGGCGSEYSSAAIGCKIFRCCVKEKGLGTCADCGHFLCSMLDGVDEADSFVTHRKMLINLHVIREAGIEVFLGEQEERRILLERMLENYNEGRSRSLFCAAAALLSVGELNSCLNDAERKLSGDGIDVKGKAAVLKSMLKEAAIREGVELELRKAGKKQ